MDVGLDEEDITTLPVPVPTADYESTTGQQDYDYPMTANMPSTTSPHFEFTTTMMTVETRVTTEATDVSNVTDVPNVTPLHASWDLMTPNVPTQKPDEVVPGLSSLLRNDHRVRPVMPPRAPVMPEKLRTDDPAVVSSTPCPSDDCWEYHPDTGSCTLKGACSWLNCDAEQIEISFTSNLFGIVDGDSTQFGIGDNPSNIAQPTWDSTEGKWKVTCAFGECGMTHQTETDELKMKVQIALVGNERTRSIIPDASISLGGVDIITAPFGIGVDFKCSYPTTFTISSNEFAVVDVTVDGSTSGTGSLAKGFTMTLNDGVNQFILGETLDVRVDWTVSTLSDVTFFLDACTVIHGQQAVNVIKDSCYSETLKVAVIEESGTTFAFSYQLFQIINQVGTEQTVNCDVQLCSVGSTCGKAQTNADCPTDAAEALYQFSTVGYTAK